MELDIKFVVGSLAFVILVLFLFLAYQFREIKILETTVRVTQQSLEQVKTDAESTRKDNIEMRQTLADTAASVRTLGKGKQDGGLDVEEDLDSILD